MSMVVYEPPSGWNLPPGCFEGDPNAPWNQEEPENSGRKKPVFSNTPGIILPLPAILTQDSTLSRYKEVFMV